MSLPFTGRRSQVFCRRAAVACTQPAATEAGLSILRAGGTAADAAVAVAAALNVTEPGSTGIGGDAFCLYYEASTGRVHAYNGSGRSAAAFSLEAARAVALPTDTNAMDPMHAHCVTVPGAAALWVDLVRLHGKLPLQRVLEPAINLCEDGFGVEPIAAQAWQSSADKLRAASPNFEELLPGGHAPAVGQLVRNPQLANTFRLLGEQGAAGFYDGPVARAIVDVVAARGGLLTLDDLRTHRTQVVDPISIDVLGVNVLECPPNGQGIVALLTLRILEAFGFERLRAAGRASPLYWHVVIEAMRLAFADARYYVTDPDFSPTPVDALLSKEYAASRAAKIAENTALSSVTHGTPANSSDTVYFCVVDEYGNACSFINSTYMPFGSGIIPKGCGFTLQNRGANFVLEEGHPNVAAGGKRPYHTIIPGMVTTPTGQLVMPFGVMGAWMQPQGHVQVLLNMLLFGMDVQTALDAARVCLQPDASIHAEEGIPADIIAALKAIGHPIRGPVTGFARGLFGRGQIIRVRRNDAGEPELLEAGTDPRGDGVAFGY